MSSSSHCAAPERRRWLGAAALLLLAPAAWARSVPPEVASELPGARLLGHGRLRFLGLHVYDASLWAPGPVGTGFESVPFALELVYARSFRGAQIAERSIEEMRNVGSFGDDDARRWLDAMTRVFPDVSAGDRITGVQHPGEGARFHFNARLAGEIRDPEFARLFFGIWLSPKSSQPRLRTALLGAGS